MYKRLNQIRFLLGKDFKRLPIFITLFLIASIFDLLGISLIIPYVSIIYGDKEFLEKNTLFSKLLLEFTLSLNTTEILGILLVIAFFIKTALAIWINKKILDFSISQEVKLRSLLMESYQKIPYEDFIRRNSTEYLYAIQTLTSQFSVNVLTPGMKMVSDGVVVMIILVFLAWINLLALILIVSLLVLTIIGYDFIFREKIQTSGKAANIANISALKAAKEGLLGLKEIRIIGKESYFYEALLIESKKYIHFHTMAVVISSAPRYMLELVLVLFVVVLVFVTKFFFGSTNNLLPTLAVFGFAAMRLIPAAYSCSYGISQIRHGSNSIELLYRDLQNSILKKSENPSKNNHEYFDSIEFINVSFKYKDRKNIVLNNISFSIKKGEAVGIIGPSGSGKTTILDLLLGLLRPTEGKILFNGKELCNEQNIKLWQRRVAYLPQQVFILDDTLKSNISFERDEKLISKILLEESINKAKMGDVVNSWQNGIDTILGEAGQHISGGQKQRIAIARALYHDREVIIMDESTSSLDSETEKEIIDEIKELKGKKTIIIIAHRLTTLAYCDRVLKLENGSLKNIEISSKIQPIDLKNI